MASIVITGCSSGIGLATAVAFAKGGHRVYATMRDTRRSGELERAAKAEGLELSIAALDVDSDQSVSRAMASIGSKHPIDVLVNNAGFERRGSVEELPLDEFRALMETNYFGAIRCIQAVVPEMRRRGTGCIVNVSSISGRIAASPFSGYVASKFALEGLSECLAQEVKPFGIRVAIVEPGIIDTPAARQVAETWNPSAYTQVRRFSALFDAALRQPTPASVVADKIVEIAESGTWQLRHPVGPDAVPFLEWRRAMSDEAWIEWGAADDEEWYARLEAEFGMQARPTE